MEMLKDVLEMQGLKAENDFMLNCINDFVETACKTDEEKVELKYHLVNGFVFDEFSKIGFTNVVNELQRLKTRTMEFSPVIDDCFRELQSRKNLKLPMPPGKMEKLTDLFLQNLKVPAVSKFALAIVNDWKIRRLKKLLGFVEIEIAKLESGIPEGYALEKAAYRKITTKISDEIEAVESNFDFSADLAQRMIKEKFPEMIRKLLEGLTEAQLEKLWEKHFARNKNLI